MRGADILATTLEDTGVEVVFGVAGSAVLGSLDAIDKSDVRFVGCRHEQVAASMATGYALASRRPTGSISHVGPGAANQIIGVAAAYRDDIPVISITGNEPSDRLGRDVRHEWDVLSVFERFTKHNVRVGADNPAQQIRDAVLQSVTGVPGPVHIDFPRDLEEADLPAPRERDRERLRSRDLRASTVRARPSRESIEETVALLEAAERPVVVAGGEIRWFDGAAALQRFAEAVHVPVVTTKNTRGALPESHPLSLGLVGRPGLDVSNEYLESADLVIGVGTRFSDITTSNWELIDPDADIVHATLRAREMDRQYLATVNAFADAGSFLSDLADAVAGSTLTFEDVAAPVRAEWETAREDFLDPTIDPAEEGVDPRKLVVAIDGASGDYSFTTGGGVHAHFPRRLLVDDLNGVFVTSNFAGMSQGFPLAAGAQVALDHQVYAFEGDGGFSMVIQDLETAAREEIPVKVVVLNNGSYMSQRARQRRYYEGRYVGTTFTNPDFAAVAEQFGVAGYTVTDDDEIDGVVDSFVNESGPAVLEARVDPWLDTGGYDRD